MVIVDKSRRKFSIYRPIDPKVPPINSNPSLIFPEENNDDNFDEESENQNQN
jgi:hypothetical protein